MKPLRLVVFGVIVALGIVRPARAELCPKCKGKVFIMNVGKCVECGGLTTSGAHKLCPKCSRKLGQCEHCRAKLKDELTPARTKKLTAAVDKFTLDVRYFGEQGKPMYNVTLRVPTVDDKRPRFSPAAQLTKKQALALIDHLAKDGYLRRAGNVAFKEMKMPKGPTYCLFARGPKDLELHEDLGWSLKMIHRLEALRDACEGDGRKAMDRLLGRMSGHKKRWEAATKGFLRPRPR